MVEHRHLIPGDVNQTALETELDMERYVQDENLEFELLNLVRIRTAQRNGCAHCSQMHRAAATARGEHPHRLDALAAWQERHDLYTYRECTALAFVEALADAAETGDLTGNSVPKQVWGEVREAFDATEVAALLISISTTNGWNRLGTTTRSPAGGDEDLST